EVYLVEYEHYLLAPLAYRVHKVALGLGEGAVSRGDEEHQVRAGHEVAGKLLVPPDDGVCAWGVHDADVAQELGGVRALHYEVGDGALACLRAVAQQIYRSGGGRDPLRQHL